MPQSFSCLHTHIVFSTKHRQPLLTPSLSLILYPYIGGIIRRRKCTLIRIGGVEDHVHLLVRQARDISTADLVGQVKANSCSYVRKELPAHHDFAWQEGYGAFSVSLSAVDNVIEYIEKQAEHHRKKTYQEEVRRFLDIHEIEYDERYMWD